MYNLEQTLTALLLPMLEGPVLPPVIFISGTQGLGKTTALTGIAARCPGLAVASLDDFYLTRQQRLQLAASVSPLYATRGPPGTHDLELLLEVIGGIKAGQTPKMPVFDKRTDDRLPAEDWRPVAGPVRALIVEGWMMGVLPDPGSLSDPALNAVEQEDRDGSWRSYQEQMLGTDYARLWDLADAFVHLDAPSFDVVPGWRLQQEETLLGLAPGGLPSDRRAGIIRFIGHFERLTRRMLAGGRRGGAAVKVDAHRRPVPELQT